MSRRGSVTREIVTAYSYVALWIALSATVIMYNKYILTVGKFPYPVGLTIWHMAFCSILAFLLVKSGVVQPIDMNPELYIKTIVPIGALYSGTLWLGNAAYLSLSVSFVQMLKAMMPVMVFVMGCLLSTEKFTTTTFGNLMVVSVGVVIAAYGEVNFVVIGVILQTMSMITESTRLVLVQILLQRRGLKLNPITSLYYIAPCCFAFLLLPFLMFELPKIRNDPAVIISVPVFFSNAAAAFALNMAIFLLIGKTSALTMNLAGIIKDWMLIALSAYLYRAPVSALNIGGYLIAIAGLSLYNYRKLQDMKKDKPPGPSAAAGPPGESVPLLRPR
eukprot:CAMPEP_0206150384 /NCGR_PEP_ID=MMETSP1473-20131121/38272_1 /ASSEMBLY_ACC=CAM_ASM_001109 /TAXON_ID=1461547 /ORGANISM="Stichococcus sp, Strain RCC1054" /LENGTH=331 /DNA_ID=CAMNT_0053547883 /DNA_START=1603 /DNA_END=2598 /DNA_ORIENTATION=+